MTYLKSLKQVMMSS